MSPLYLSSELRRASAERLELAAAYRELAARYRSGSGPSPLSLEESYGRAGELEASADRLEAEGLELAANARRELRRETRPRRSRLRPRLEEAGAPSKYLELRRAGHAPAAALELARALELLEAAEARGLLEWEFGGEPGEELPLRLYLLGELLAELDLAELEAEVSELEARAYLSISGEEELRGALAVAEANAGFFAEGALLAAGLSPAAAEELSAALNLEAERLEAAEEYRGRPGERELRYPRQARRRAARIRCGLRSLEEAGRELALAELGCAPPLSEAAYARRSEL